MKQNIKSSSWYRSTSFLKKVLESKGIKKKIMNDNDYKNYLHIYITCIEYLFNVLFVRLTRTSLIYIYIASPSEFPTITSTWLTYIIKDYISPNYNVSSACSSF